jgi:integrase
MGAVRLHGKWLQIRYRLKDGTWSGWTSTKFRKGQEHMARRAIVNMEERERSGLPALGNTVGDWIDAGIKKMRAKEKAGTAWNTGTTKWLLSLYRALRAIPLDDLTADDVANETDRIAETHAPRTAAAAFMQLRKCLREPVRLGLLDRNPCDGVDRDRLPVKRDADPDKRRGAVYTREEIALLLTPGVLPERLRVTCAFLACTGPRFGELAALRFSDIVDGDPLPRVIYGRSFHRQTGKFKATKTGAVKWVPMLPELAEIFDGWRAQWVEDQGHVPAPSDLVVPGAMGGPQREPYTLELWTAELERIGMRHRTLHNLRATFITLGLAAGARPDILRTCTHAKVTAGFYGYDRPAWPIVCAEVSKLTYQIASAEVVQMTAAANGSWANHGTAAGNSAEPAGVSGGRCQSAGSPSSPALDRGAQRERANTAAPSGPHRSDVCAEQCSPTAGCTKCPKAGLARRALTAITNNDLSLAIALLERIATGEP